MSRSGNRGGGDVDPADVGAMLARIVHRGPDGEGTWHAGPVAFGHHRLAILDTSNHASQPLVTSDGKGTITYNGETYNDLELRRELEAAGHTFRSTGDTEVVLTALHHWGPEAAIPRLNGMFALAYFDRRSTTLWLARDRLGIKTLVTVDAGDEILFASEVKALLAHPRMPMRVDDMALTKWIVSPLRHAHRYLFELVEPVAAGSWWKITAAGIEKHCYYHAIDAIDIDRLAAACDDRNSAFADETESLLKKSVELPDSVAGARRAGAPATIRKHVCDWHLCRPRTLVRRACACRRPAMVPDWRGGLCYRDRFVQRAANAGLHRSSGGVGGP